MSKPKRCEADRFEVTATFSIHAPTLREIGPAAYTKIILDNNFNALSMAIHKKHAEMSK